MCIYIPMFCPLVVGSSATFSTVDTACAHVYRPDPFFVFIVPVLFGLLDFLMCSILDSLTLNVLFWTSLVY